MNHWSRNAILAGALLTAVMVFAQNPVSPSSSSSVPAQTPSGAATQSSPPTSATEATTPESEAFERNRRRGRTSVTIQMSEQDAERLREAIQDPELKAMIKEHIDRIGNQINPTDWRGPAMTAFLVPISFFALMGLLGWLIYRRGQERTRARMDMHTALLAKFSTGAEFTEFISSPGGKEYMERLTANDLHRHGRYGRSIWIGYVFTAMGAGMLIVRGIEGHGSLMGGVILLAIGVGHLLSMRSARKLDENMNQPTLPGGGTTPPSAGSSTLAG